jgi:TRAP-type C4-dicarboxylate transport system permease small subunit
MESSASVVLTVFCGFVAITVCTELAVESINAILPTLPIPPVVALMPVPTLVKVKSWKSRANP